MTENSAQETVDFGFESVPREQKQPRVKAVFDSVAAKYDVMNDVMSFGLHRHWKQHFVRQIPLRAGMKMLDLAGGTGDISLRALRRFHAASAPLSATISDINAAMLAEGKTRAIDGNWQRLGQIDWLEANAETLPLPERQFDVVTMAFGIRNVTDRPKALAEIYRVLKPGGLFLCLEFTPPSPHYPSAITQLYDAYSFQLIPAFGKMITGDADSYRYLVESIRQFPSAEVFESMIGNAGFTRTHYETLSMGTVAIHKGWKV